MLYCKHCKKFVKGVLDLIEMKYTCEICGNYIENGE